MHTCTGMDDKTSQRLATNPLRTGLGMKMNMSCNLNSDTLVLVVPMDSCKLVHSPPLTLVCNLPTGSLDAPLSSPNPKHLHQFPLFFFAHFYFYNVEPVLLPSLWQNSDLPLPSPHSKAHSKASSLESLLRAIPSSPLLRPVQSSVAEPNPIFFSGSFN